MSPLEYRKARSNAVTGNKDEQLICVTVDGKPYMPFLKVDPFDESSIAFAVVTLLNHQSNQINSNQVNSNHSNHSNSNHINSHPIHEFQNCSIVKISKVSGGITNALFRVVLQSADHRATTPTTATATATAGDDPSILIRIFGAEGMIDRDIENSTYAALSSVNIAPPYYGRFANGRLEGWLNAPYECCQIEDLHQNSNIFHAIAVQMARLHQTFQIPKPLLDYHNPSEPSLWNQLHDWMEQAQALKDTFASSSFNFLDISKEIDWWQTEHIVPSRARVAFCHNDLLPGNIMFHAPKNIIQLIDFEYGGINFCAFDIANHFNEFCGGTEDATPDYALFPTQKKQTDFIQAYLEESSRCQATVATDDDATDEDAATRVADASVSPDQIHALYQEVQAFVLVNHVYWG